jgi:predicted nucleic acid-binding protein
MEGGVRSSAASTGKAFGDTSYFFALLSPHDPNHEQALEMSREVTTQRLSVYTTWDVVVETVALLRYRTSFEVTRVFLTEVTPDLIVVHPDETEREAAIQLFLRRSRALKLSLCDALSYTIVSSRLDWAPCLAFDADFAALGLTILR